MTKFEDLPKEMQRDGVGAVIEFLRDNGYANLDEAAKALNCSHQMVWDKIMSTAGLPECETPGDDIPWPRFVPLPEPGQSIEDDECEWISFDIATVSDVETFLAAEPDWAEKPDWCTPLTIMGFKCLVESAKQRKVDPDECLLLALGMITKH
ncbi:MAG: hypothetical protein IIC57_03240 [Proteobacteria bacterium]|nr:hypothetical protein [Pseudomonadota bacterium]